MKAELLSTHIGNELADHCVERILRRLAVYTNVGSITQETLPVSRLIPLSRCVVWRRLFRARELLEATTRAGAAPYVPLLAEVGDKCRLVIPPVVERWNDDFYVIDGTHRLVAAMRHGLHEVSVIVVAGDELPPLPCTPGIWDDIATTTTQMPLEVVLPGVDRRHFRPVTIFCNNSPHCEFHSRTHALTILNQGDQ